MRPPDLPSPPRKSPLEIEAMWVAVSSGPEAAAAIAVATDQASPESRPTGGPSSVKSPVTGSGSAQKSTEFQRFGPGVAYYGYRWFDPATGRWPSRDPIGERGGINLYGLLSNNAVNNYDYLGQIVGETIAIAKTAAELALDQCPKRTSCKEDCIACCKIAHTAGQAAMIAAYTAEMAQCAALTFPPAIAGCIALKTAVYGAEAYLLSQDNQQCESACALKIQRNLP